MHFTPREQDILHLCADLHSGPEIVAILGYSKHTLDKYLGQMYEKADVHSYFSLVKYALENGYGCRFQAIAQEVCLVEVKVAEQCRVRNAPKPKVVIRVRKPQNATKLVVERRLV